MSNLPVLCMRQSFGELALLPVSIVESWKMVFVRAKWSNKLQEKLHFGCVESSTAKQTKDTMACPPTCVPNAIQHTQRHPHAMVTVQVENETYHHQVQMVPWCPLK